MVKVGKGDKEREEARPLATVADLQKLKLFDAIVIRTRLNPYKTRLKPNFEIDWGIEKIEADPFVERQKRPVQVFDIKEYIKNQRKDKFMNMVESAGSGMASMPGSAPMPGIPPFGANPFEVLKNNPEPGSSAGINVEDLVKKIDAKIAELEKEEEEEKKRALGAKANEEKQNEKVESVNDIIDLPSEVKEDKKEIEEIKPIDDVEAFNFENLVKEGVLCEEELKMVNDVLNQIIKES